MSETAAQAAHDEVTGRQKVFRWTHTTDDGQTHTLELAIPRRFKRFKFARLIAAGDFLGALELLFGAEAIRAIEDWEMDDVEFEQFMAALGEAIAGTGN